MEENKKTKKSGLVIGLLILLLVAVIILIILVAMNLARDKGNNGNNNLQENNVEEVALDSLEAAEFIKLYDNIMPVEYRCGELYYHNSDKVLESNLDNQLKISLSYNLMKNEISEGLYSSVNAHGDYQTSETYLENAYYALFGNNSKYVFTDSNSCPILTKETPDEELYPLANGNIYISTQCGGMCNVGDIGQKIIRLEKSKDQKELYIYERVVYQDSTPIDSDSNDIMFDISYYQDKEKTILVGTSKESTIDEIMKNDSLSTYKYTFKYQPIDNQNTIFQTYGSHLNNFLSHQNYYFYSVERIK